MGLRRGTAEVPGQTQVAQPGPLRFLGRNSVPGQIMEQTLSKHISGCTKEEKVIRNHQHRFTKGKSCLTNASTFCDKITGFANEGGGAVNVICLKFARLSTLHPTAFLYWDIMVWMSRQPGKICWAQGQWLADYPPTAAQWQVGPGLWTSLSLTWRRPFLCCWDVLCFKGRTGVTRGHGILSDSRVADFWDLVREQGKFRWQFWRFPGFEN